MAKEKKFIVTTGGDRPIQDIAKELADAGLKGVEVLQEIGSITGSAEEEAVAKLRKVRGIVDISQDVPVDVGPPGSSNTW
jgi:uncharacterized protein with ACT and thioredoxin-like domain